MAGGTNTCRKEARLPVLAATQTKLQLRLKEGREESAEAERPG